jgi:hypothetical protein
MTAHDMTHFTIGNFMRWGMAGTLEVIIAISCEQGGDSGRTSAFQTPAAGDIFPQTKPAIV